MKEVPKKFWSVHVSPIRITASTEANMGYVLEMGTDRATPKRSIPMRLKVRARPGEKMPPARKNQTAGVRKLDRGTKKVTITHRITADMLRENRDAVIPLDVTNPRRLKTWAKAKQNAAWMAKYSLML